MKTFIALLSTFAALSITACDDDDTTADTDAGDVVDTCEEAFALIDECPDVDAIPLTCDQIAMLPCDSNVNEIIDCVVAANEADTDSNGTSDLCQEGLPICNDQITSIATCAITYCASHTEEPVCVAISQIGTDAGAGDAGGGDVDAGTSDVDSGCGSSDCG